MKTRSAKAKGRNAANEAKQLIHDAYPEFRDEDVIRTSGGVIGEDIVLSPRARAALPVSIEVKNQESIRIWQALKQCETNAKDYEPVLFFKRNRSKMYAIVDATTLLYLLRKTYGSEKDIGQAVFDSRFLQGAGDDKATLRSRDKYS